MSERTTTTKEEARRLELVSRKKLWIGLLSCINSNNYKEDVQLHSYETTASTVYEGRWLLFKVV